MAKTSAGLLLFRRTSRSIEVLLAHPGGPLWAHKDLGAWTIPKGQYDKDEEPIDAARREFLEETGFAIDGPFLPLKPVRQASGKVVTAWAVERDLDATAVRSNLCTLEWPPRSGRFHEIPEIDRAEWFPLIIAAEKINPGQRPLLGELETLLQAS